MGDGFESAELGIPGAGVALGSCADCAHPLVRHGPDGCMVKKPKLARSAGLWTAHCSCKRTFTATCALGVQTSAR